MISLGLDIGSNSVGRLGRILTSGKFICGQRFPAGVDEQESSAGAQEPGTREAVSTTQLAA